jgi:hypothetical protein
MEINHTQEDQTVSLEDKIVQLDREIQAQIAALHRPQDLAAKNKLYRQYREWTRTGYESKAISQIAREI